MLNNYPFAQFFAAFTHGLRTMGSIVRSGDKWRAHAHVNGVRKSKVFGRKGDAKHWLDEIESTLANRSDETLHQAIDRYERTRSREKKGHSWEAKHFPRFKAYFDDKPLSDVSKADIAQWRDDRLKSVKSSTVSRELTLLSSIFTEAIEWEWIKSNPCKEVRRPKQPPHRTRVFSDDEIERICLALDRGEKSRITRAAFLLSLETGMRSGEILAIEPAQVGKQTIHIPESKNGLARDVPLSKKARAIVSEYGTEFGKLNPASRDTLFRKSLRKVGITDATFHDARRTAATRLSKILTPHQLARMLGHTSLAYALVYYHEEAQDLAKLLD